MTLHSVIFYPGCCYSWNVNKEWGIALAFPKPRADFYDSQTKHAPSAKTLLLPPIEMLTTMHAAFSLCQENLLRSNSICWPLSDPCRKHDKQIILTQGAYFRPNPLNKLNNLDTKDRDNQVVLLEYWREPLQIIKANVGCADATI